MKDMKIADIIDLGADILEVEGWCVGVTGMKFCGPKCAEGALAQASGMEPEPIFGGGELGYDLEKTKDLPAVQAMQRFVDHPELWRWNDSRPYYSEPGREVVIQTMRRCAASLR